MMSKRIFSLLVVLMSLSLIGIISLQAYYIKNSFDNEKERFTFKVKTALANVSNQIEDEELATYFKKYQTWLNSAEKKEADSLAVSQLFIYQKNNNTKQTLIYKSGVIEENYKLSSSLFDIGLDSVYIQNIIGKSNTEIYDNFEYSEDNDGQSPILNIINNGTIGEAQTISLDKSFKAIAKRTPVHERVSRDEIDYLLLP